MGVIKEYVEEMRVNLNETINKLIIDDIFDISNGLYNSYDDYLEQKQRITEMVRNHNNNNQYFNPHNENYRFTYYAEPVLLSQVVFNYIVNKNNLK